MFIYEVRVRDLEGFYERSDGLFSSFENAREYILCNYDGVRSLSSEGDKYIRSSVDEVEFTIIRRKVME